VSTSVPSILVVRFSSIGDLILTTPLLRALRARHPAARIAFVVREDMADVLRHNPRITDLITWKHRASLLDLGRTLRAQPWTHRLDLHGSLRSMLLRRLVGGEWGSYSKQRRRRRQLIRTGGREGGFLGAVADRYFEAAAGLDVVPDGGPAEVFTSSTEERAASEFLARHQLGQTRGLVAISPGAAHFTKRWPTEYWSALVRRLVHQSDVVVLGGPGDREAAAAIAEAGGAHAASAAGEFSISGTAALLKRTKVLAAGDTGVLHLATAVGTPVVGLYGPTVEQFGFFPYHARAAVLQRDLPCRPCTAHGGAACPLGHHNCLRSILPEEVAAAMSTPPR
jgi:heptosyltransferase II